MMNAVDNQDTDPVSIGIREWQKVKQAAEEAIEQAKTATEEAAFYRGQCELMQQQRKADEATMRRLQQHCDEMNIMVESLGAAVLSIVEKRKAGMFRRAGSSPSNGAVERLRPVPIKNGEMEESIRELASSAVRPELRPQPPINR